AAQSGAALVEVIGLEDDLHLGRVPVSFITDGPDVTLDVVPVAAQRLADVDHHVDLERAILAGQFGFVAFGLRGAVAVGKADNTAHAHAAAPEQIHGALHRIRLDANRRDTVCRGQFAAVLELLIA